MSDLSQPLDLHHSLRRAAAQARRLHPWPLTELARQCRVSVGELVAAHAGLHPRHESPLQAVRLQPSWAAALGELQAWGPLTLRLPGDDLCLSAHGRWQDRCAGPQPGLLMAPGHSLCLAGDGQHGAHAFAVHDEAGEEARRCVMVLDRHGQPLLELGLTPESDLEAYASWVARHASPSPAPGLSWPSRLHARPRASAPTLSPSTVRAAWLSTRLAQDGEHLHERWGLTRHQLLALADPRYVQAVEPGALHDLWRQLARSQLACVWHVGQPGLSLRWHGRVQTVHPQGGWLSASHPPLHLALRDEAVATAWRVCHPTSQGLHSHLELFDHRQQRLLRLSSGALPPQPEPRAWHALLAQAADVAPDCALV